MVDVILIKLMDRSSMIEWSDRVSFYIIQLCVCFLDCSALRDSSSLNYQVGDQVLVFFISGNLDRVINTDATWGKRLTDISRGSGWFDEGDVFILTNLANGLKTVPLVLVLCEMRMLCSPWARSNWDITIDVGGLGGFPVLLEQSSFRPGSSIFLLTKVSMFCECAQNIKIALNPTSPFLGIIRVGPRSIVPVEVGGGNKLCDGVQCTSKPIQTAIRVGSGVVEWCGVRCDPAKSEREQPPRGGNPSSRGEVVGVCGFTL
jgi:hypothetical protein